MPRQQARASLWWWRGLAYNERPGGDRADNLEQAIAAFERSLQFFTPAKSPADWGSLQNNLGLAYEQRILGDRADNLEKAIGAYQAALTVRTREGFVLNRKKPSVRYPGLTIGIIVAIALTTMVWAGSQAMRQVHFWDGQAHQPGQAV